MGELVSSKKIFSLVRGAGNSLGLCMHFFLPFVLHDLFSVKALQEFFSQIFHSNPPPPKDQIVHHLSESLLSSGYIKSVNIVHHPSGVRQCCRNPKGGGGGRGEYYSQLTIREYANLKGCGFRSIPWFGKEYESVNPKRFLASSPVISSARLVGTVSGAVTFVLIQVRHLEKEG